MRSNLGNREREPRSDTGRVARSRRGPRPAARFVAACALVATAMAGSPAAAATKHWLSVPEQSSIAFEYESNGRPAAGIFTRFSGAGLFDPETPGATTLEIHIQSASIDLDDAAASAFATSTEWFDSATHPEVVYRLLRLTPQGGNRFRAEGELTIRGTTRPLTTTITLDVSADEAHATGTLQIDRKDYQLGVGPMSLFVSIGREVAVSFDMTAQPVQ